MVKEGDVDVENENGLTCDYCKEKGMEENNRQKNS